MTSSSRNRSDPGHPGTDPDTPGVAVPEPRLETPAVPEVDRPVAGRGEVVGYARVSTRQQDEALQLDALRAAGATRVFVDRGVSGSVPLADRPAWGDLLDYARPGDAVAVYRLDRLTRRGLRDLLQVVADLRDQRGVAVRSLTEPIDTSGPAGELILAIVGWVAEQERETLRRRTRDGLAAARARGSRPGRPPVDAEKVTAARDLVLAGHSVTRAAATLGLGRSTLYRQLQEVVR